MTDGAGRYAALTCTTPMLATTGMHVVSGLGRQTVNYMVGRVEAWELSAYELNK